MNEVDNKPTASILLVDDTPENLQLLIEALGDQEYEVRPAINGELALESARSFCPDLILLDIHMPGMDGYEVCRRLKADPLTRDTPVLFISSAEETFDKVRAFQAGGIDFIPKPFQAEEVLARIHNHLALSQTQQRLQKEIVERSRVQAELETHQQHLEELVKKRTSELETQNRELLASEQRFAALSNQFETLLEAISDPLALLSAELQPVWTNQAYDRAWQQLLAAGGNPELTLFQRGGSNRESPVLSCFKKGTVIEDLLTTPDGRKWGIKVFPLKNAAGETAQVLATASDVTEKVRLRDEANRAGRLASLGELSAGIAHEINNPNAVILLNAPIIREAFTDAIPLLNRHLESDGDFQLAGLTYRELREELPGLLERIEESSQRISRIVEDLKTFVRQGNTESFTPVDLCQVVSAAERLMASTIKKSTDHFTVEFEVENLVVIGDFQKLEQVIINLIQNACQALPDRSCAVKVETFQERGTGQVGVRVSDQGVGIPPALLSQVTDPFFTTKRASGGTGLGLSVSARLVEEHGGRLEIVSEPGEGSSFTLLLPAAMPEEES